MMTCKIWMFIAASRDDFNATNLGGDLDLSK